MTTPCFCWPSARLNKRYSSVILAFITITVVVAVYQISDVVIANTTTIDETAGNIPLLSQNLPYIQKNGRTDSGYDSNGSTANNRFADETNLVRYGHHSEKAIVIAIVSCGVDRREQTIVSIKSAIILSRSELHFVIMADDENKQHLIETISKKWPQNILKNISFEIRPIQFPSGSDKWKKLFKPCASQRLFLPSLLPHVDSAIYIDNDVLFLSPPEQLWSQFSRMNQSHMAALAPEHEDYSAGWYNRFAKHPFVKPLGVNSGVMLMNLTRMRDFLWERFLEPVYEQYKLEIVWGDQDIINIIFHFHSDKLHIVPCHWNYRPDHCIYSQVCKTIYEHGVKLLHGNRDAFTNDKFPAFRAIYDAMKMYTLGTDVDENLLEPMIDMLGSTEYTSCGKHQRYIIKSLEESLEKPDSEN
ncbi:Glucoside xylosyltransferase 2 [Halotydeus destructor]|nr:Glucoside xylosyltransferase 2 [Halotydeus destructor]